MKKIKKIFEFKEGIGGGGQPSYILYCDGGNYKGFPKDKFTLEQARAFVLLEIEDMREMFGSKQVTFLDKLL